MNRKHAVFDDLAIWGVGETPEEAWDDVRQWVSDPDGDLTGMRCAPMTHRLAQIVDREGGAVRFSYSRRHDMLMTSEAASRL